MSENKSLAERPDDSTTLHELLHHKDAEAEHVGLFVELCSRMAEQFDINRAVLIVRGSSADQLTAVSTWTTERVRRSLRINLPKQKSLLQKIIESRLTYTDNFAYAFSGNSLEKQLLLGDDATAFAVHPLRVDNEIVGLVGFAAASESALAAFDIAGLNCDFQPIADAIKRYRRHRQTTSI